MISIYTLFVLKRYSLFSYYQKLIHLDREFTQNPIHIEFGFEAGTCSAERSVFKRGDRLFEIIHQPKLETDIIAQGVQYIHEFLNCFCFSISFIFIGSRYHCS